LQRVRAYFGKIDGITFIENRGWTLVGVDGRVLLRFKKLGKDKRSSNYPTAQQQKFAFQFELPGFPPEAARLTVGYQLNNLQTEIERILVTYPNGKQLHWDFEVLPQTSERTVIKLPQIEVPVERVKVRPKFTAKKKIHLP
jgi:hypothetical protein